MRDSSVLKLAAHAQRGAEGPPHRVAFRVLDPPQQEIQGGPGHFVQGLDDCGDGGIIYVCQRGTENPVTATSSGTRYPFSDR